MYRILLADGDSAYRTQYSQMKVWSEYGFYIADGTGSANSAEEYLHKNKYDLLIADVKLPFFDGIELAYRAKALIPEIAVVFISSCTEFEFVRRALIAGAADYLPKPVSEAEIAMTLRCVKLRLDKKAGFASPVLAALNTLDIAVPKDSVQFMFCRYFSEHYADGISMSEMAEYFGYSKDYFGKIFKAGMTVSFNNFISVLRIEYAKELLKSGNYKIYEISELLGYASVDYFTKVFSKYTGNPPSNYKYRINDNTE